MDELRNNPQIIELLKTLEENGYMEIDICFPLK